MTKDTKPKSIVKATSYQIDKPQQMEKAAKLITKYVKDNKLSVEIQKNQYVMVEGWQYAGGLMGLFPRIVSVEQIAEEKWLAKAEVIEKKTGSVVGVGFGLCSKSEYKKRTFDEYAILSMAQTRAIGKAFRNIVGWVIKLSGYEACPAEEYKSGMDVPKVPKESLENKIKMIQTQTDPLILKGWRKSINSSTKYTLAEKQAFNKEIIKKLDEIENPKN